MRGGTSHVELDQEFALHSLLSDGKVIRVQAFLSWREALEAAGLAGVGDVASKPAWEHRTVRYFSASSQASGVLTSLRSSALRWLAT